MFSAAGIRWLAPDQYVHRFTERLSVFDSQKDDIDLIFIGSSHYRSGIDPLLFDRMTAKAGCPTNSFSFSLPGLHLPEMLHVLQRIRSLGPSGLKWVVLEPRMMVHFGEENSRKQRLIYYHDVPATLMALTSIQHQDEPAEGRFPHYRRHIEQFGYRQTNQGLVRSLITDLYKRNAPARTDEIQHVVSGKGYNPRDGHRLSLSRRRNYEEKVRVFSATYRQSPLKPQLADQLAKLTREIEAMGARTIFLFPPTVDYPFELQLPMGGPPVDQIRLDEVEHHPELFALENRWDQGHMNTAGASLTTAAAAEAFIRIASGKDER